MEAFKEVNKTKTHCVKKKYATYRYVWQFWFFWAQTQPKIRKKKNYFIFFIRQVLPEISFPTHQIIKKNQN